MVVFAEILGNLKKNLREILKTAEKIFRKNAKLFKKKKNFKTTSPPKIKCSFKKWRQ